MSKEGSECDFEPRFCNTNVFSELKHLYDECVRASGKGFSNALELFESIAEGTIRPRVTGPLVSRAIAKKGPVEAQRSADQRWRSCKGHLYEYAVCRALHEVIANNPQLKQKLEVVHGSKLSDFTRSQLVIRNWSEILPDVDFAIVNKSCGRVVAVLSCKTSLRERLTETAFWARELKPKGIDVIFITVDKDREIVADVNRYVVLHVLDYTIITEPSMYSSIVSEWRRRYGNKPDFKIVTSKVVSFRDISRLLQHYAAMC